MVSTRHSMSETCCSRIATRSALPARSSPRPTSTGTRSRSTTSRSSRSAASTVVSSRGPRSSTSITVTRCGEILRSPCSTPPGSSSTSAAIRTSHPTSPASARATISTTCPGAASANSMASSARCSCRRATRPAADRSRGACLSLPRIPRGSSATTSRCRATNGCRTHSKPISVSPRPIRSSGSSPSTPSDASPRITSGSRATCRGQTFGPLSRRKSIPASLSSTSLRQRRSACMPLPSRSAT